MISLNKHKISAIINQRYATIVYLFDFYNKNDHHSNELSFEITIDSDAFVSSFEANIDGKIFHGVTKEKNKASKEYNDAKEKDENAILISQPYKNIPNVFKISSNIDSKSNIILKISIQQLLTKKFNYNQLNIEILKEFQKYNILQNYNSIDFDININDKSGIYDVNIPSSNTNNHNIIMNKYKTNCLINGKIMYNVSTINELILKYKIKGEQNDNIILYDNKSNIFCHIISDIITDSMIDINSINEGYDDDDIKENILIPRRVVFIIDRSGSMKGNKWNETINATITALKQLRTLYDKYSIILFDHDIEMFKDKMIISTKDNISKSIKYLQSKSVRGSTNINKALLTGIKLIKKDILNCNNNNDNYNYFMNQIIFITDGEPNEGITNSEKILLNIENENILNNYKYCNKISIFSFGVGDDSNDGSWVKNLNHSLLRLLSLNNNGLYKRIKKNQANTLLEEYYNVLSKPILSNIHIKYHINDDDIDDNNQIDIKYLTKTKFNTLYAGNDIIICGKIDGNNNNKQINLNAKISAVTGREIKENNVLVTKPVNIEKTMKLYLNSNDDDDNDDNADHIERIWAYLKLQQFVKNKLINDNGNDDYDGLSPLDLALKYKFVTPWTSMIVVKKKEFHHYPTPKPVLDYNKITDIQSEIDRAMDTVRNGISLAIDRGDMLDDLDDKAQLLSSQASVFNKKAKHVRRHFCLQKWKCIALIVFVMVLLIIILWVIIDQTSN